MILEAFWVGVVGIVSFYRYDETEAIEAGFALGLEPISAKRTGGWTRGLFSISTYNNINNQILKL